MPETKSILNMARTVPKRATAGAGLALFQIFLLIWPDLLSEQTQRIIYESLGFLGATGLADWIWRNRKTAFAFLKNLFKKKPKPDTLI